MFGIYFNFDMDTCARFYQHVPGSTNFVNPGTTFTSKNIV